MRCGLPAEDLRFVLAHINSTGVNVPIFINANPTRMPSIGYSMAYQAGSDAAIQEAVFMGKEAAFLGGFFVLGQLRTHASTIGCCEAQDIFSYPTLPVATDRAVAIFAVPP